MASDEKCNRSAATLPSDYGQRAAIALDELIPSQHRDKTVARLFDVSVRFAKYLRRGQYWTIDRLDQASRLIEHFDEFVASPEKMRGIRMEMDELDKRLAKLEQERKAEDARGFALQAMGTSGVVPTPGAASGGVVRETETATLAVNELRNTPKERSGTARKASSTGMRDGAHGVVGVQPAAPPSIAPAVARKVRR